MYLKLIYQLKEYPHKDAHTKDEVWASIKMEVWDINSEPVVAILDFEWDIFVFLSWCIENKYYLLNEKFPKYIKFDTSIAKSIFDFYEDDSMDDSMDGDEFSIFSVLYDYRSRHGLRFAFRGTDIDDVYIGTIENIPFVSCYTNDKMYNYTIDLEKFIAEVQDIYNFLLLQTK